MEIDCVNSGFLRDVYICVFVLLSLLVLRVGFGI